MNTLYWAQLGAEKFGYCAAASKAVVVCKTCGAHKHRSEFASNKQFKRAARCIMCTDACLCAYCGEAGKGVTDEHLLPKSVGGSTIIAACTTCNQSRGRSGKYAPFRRYIAANPVDWASAVLSSKCGQAEVLNYIIEENLQDVTLLALLRVFTQPPPPLHYNQKNMPATNIA